MDKNKELIVTPVSTNQALQEVQNKEAIEVFTKIAEGANTGVKTQGDAILMYMKARELGVGFGNAIPHMHVINGKVGLDIHIIRALLSKPGSGIRWETINYFEPVYNYITKDGAVIPHSKLPKNITILSNKDFATTKQEGDNLIITPMPNKNKKGSYVISDYITTYKFTRKKKDVDGTFFEIEEIGSFSWQEAMIAGLPLNKKGEISADSPWYKYKPLMVEVRAFTLGARRIASDLLMGVYEKSELFDISGKNYIVTEDGNATVIDQ